MRHALGAVAISLALAGLAIAGDAPALKGPGVLAQEIERLCRSQSPRDIAWGAYLAATHAPLRQVPIMPANPFR